MPRRLSKISTRLACLGLTAALLGAAEVPATQPALEVSGVVREGTHFIKRTGTLSRSPGGREMLFTFDPQDAGGKPLTMIAQPNFPLFSMESISTARDVPMNFIVSGTVSEYNGKNYILIDMMPRTLSPRSKSKPQTHQQSAAPKKTEPVAPATEFERPKASTAPAISKVNSAQSTMTRLLAPPPVSGSELPLPTTPAVSVDNTSGKSAVLPDAPVNQMIREGSYLTNRIGRLNHNAETHQAFFTFDTDGKTMNDAPMIILPNLKLAAMEGAVTSKAADVHFRISGSVTEYKGRNYILLDKAVAIADVENQF